MKADRRKPSQAVKDGQATGAWLAKNAADFLLRQYSNRPSGKRGKACEEHSRAWEDLVRLLGPTADAPDIAVALHRLDEAHGDMLVETEDRAWYGAWTVAMTLKGGR